MWWVEVDTGAVAHAADLMCDVQGGGCQGQLLPCAGQLSPRKVAGYFMAARGLLGCPPHYHSPCRTCSLG